MANGLKLKTIQLLNYIIKNNPGVSITGLMKFSYIVDLVAVNKGHNKISDFNYIRYNYGPFDKKIYSYLEKLITNGTIHETATMASTGDEFVTFKLNKKTKLRFERLTETEQNIIDEVLESLKGYGAKALTDLTYRTKPMKKIGAKIDNTKGLGQSLDLNTI
jgi:uncharacterized phage-associated protein